MVKQIVILEEGGRDPIVELPWGRDLDSDGLTQGQEDAWDRLCLALVLRSRAEPAPPLEIFVCLDDLELSEPPDRRALAALLQRIRDRSWGARIFLVANRDLLPDSLVTDGRESRQRYLETALAGRADDLLQVSYDPDNLWLPRGQDLRAAADRSREKWDSIRRLRPRLDSWSCILSPQENLLFQLLLPWARGAEEQANRVVVINVTSQARQIAIVDEAIERYGGPDPDCVWVVASLRKASRGLIERCRARRLSGPIEVKGALELWYFLLRLSTMATPSTQKTMQSVAGTSPAWTSNGYIESVAPDASLVFSSPSPDREPEILVTSSFDPGEKAQCLEAARDVGWFVERCTPGSKLWVEPAVSLGKLFRILDRYPEINVWIHLGHGDWGGELEIDRAWEAPETWLDCFRERHIPLAVVLFLTCHSSLAARRFVEAGVGVGVGFNELLDARLSRELAVHVLEEIREQGLQPHAALQGFRRGLHRLVVQEHEPSLPKAFSRSS